MVHETDRDDDLEVVDSAHEASTEQTEPGVEEFWAVIKNSGPDMMVTIELRLRDEEGVLERHASTQRIAAESSERYRFLVEIPANFDQYEFAIAEREEGVNN